MKPFYKAMCFAVLFSINLHPQVIEEWVARYNGPVSGYDVARDIAIDIQGNVYVTGSSQGIGSGQDFLTIKYNSDGIEQWIARFNGPLNHHDQAYSLAVDDSGNVFVTGGSFGTSTERDYLTIKYNINGDTIWTRRYNGPGFDLDESVLIELDEENNVYITGYSDSGDNVDYFTIKYNSSGTQLWASRYNGPSGPLGSEDRPHALTLDKFGNVYITGESSAGIPGLGLDMYATVKYDEYGDTVWVARYKGPGAEGLSQAYAIDVDDSGNVYVTGRSDPYSPEGFNFDMLTIKYNRDGDSVWVARYNGPNNKADVANSLLLDPDRNIIISGGSGLSGFYSDFCTIKYDTNGDIHWVVRYNGPADHVDSGTSLAVDKKGNIYVAGLSEGIGTERDYATIKYNPDGAEQWVMRYNGPGNGDDEIKAMLIDSKGNVYVTGNSFGNGMDYATIKYSPIVTTTEIGESVVKEYTLEQNYPNPFNPSTTIKFALAETQKAQLKVFDLLGNEVAVLFNDVAAGGKLYEVEFNAASHSGEVRNLSSGIYFYQLATKSKVVNKKMLLIK